MILRSARRVLALAVTLVALGACGGSPSTPSGLPGPLPEDAACPDATCAFAAAQYFISLHGPAVRGEDFAMWEALSMPTCEFCLDTMAVKDENRANGAVVTGAEASLAESPDMLDQDAESGIVAIIALARIDEATYHYPDGTTESIPEAWVTLWIGMEWSGKYWQVRRIGVT
jgi:hypothetical protein